VDERIEIARRTGKPSPSSPEGAVVTVITGRSCWTAGSVSGTRGNWSMDATVTAGMENTSEVVEHRCKHRYPGRYSRTEA